MSRFIGNPYPLEIINGKMYEVRAEYPITKVLDANLIKKWLGVDTAFKVNRNGSYIFCNEIQDVDWEDIQEKSMI